MIDKFRARLVLIVAAMLLSAPSFAGNELVMLDSFGQVPITVLSTDPITVEAPLSYQVREQVGYGSFITESPPRLSLFLWDTDNNPSSGVVPPLPFTVNGFG